MQLLFKQSRRVITIVYIHICILIYLNILEMLDECDLFQDIIQRFSQGKRSLINHSTKGFSRNDIPWMLFPDKRDNWSIIWSHKNYITIRVPQIFTAKEHSSLYMHEKHSSFTAGQEILSFLNATLTTSLVCRKFKCFRSTRLYAITTATQLMAYTTLSCLPDVTQILENCARLCKYFSWLRLDLGWHTGLISCSLQAI